MRRLFAILLLALGLAAPAIAQTNVVWGLTSGNNVCVYDQSPSHACVTLGLLNSTSHTLTLTGPGNFSSLAVSGAPVATTSGALVNGGCVSVNSLGQFVTVGGPCTSGGGGGTVNAALAGQLAYYVSAGNAVSGATTGTGVLAALAANTGTAGSVVVNGGALGTPSNGVLTNTTGLPISTGVSGLGANVATALGLSLNGTGAISATTGPTFVAPALGTPASGVATNLTGLPLATGVTGTLQAAQEPAHNGDVTNSAGSLSTTIANNAVTNAKAAQMAATTVKCNYGAALANAADCTPAQINSFIDTTGATNVRQYGAVGDNVHDDSTAFQNALVASAQGELHIPCGHYLITTSITVTTIAVYHIVGEGTCSRIHFANTAAAVLFNFNFTGTCGYAGVCVQVENVYFDQPDFQNINTIALKFNNGAEMRITRNTFLGWGQAINMQVAFGSTIDKNQFFNGTYAQISCSADASCNNVNILDNGFFNNVSVAVIGTAVDCSTVNVNIVGNDVEGNGTGFLIQGVCSGILEGNYFERTPAPFYFGNGQSSSWTITGNQFSGDTITPSTSTFVLQNVSGLVFGGNTWYYQTLSYGSNLSGVVWYPQKNQGGGGLPSQCGINAKCSYLPNGMLLQTGTATTGAGSPGSVAVTFPTACPSVIFGVSAVDFNGASPGNGVSVSSPSLTGMTIWSVTGGIAVSWQVMCQ